MKSGISFLSLILVVLTAAFCHATVFMVNDDVLSEDFDSTSVGNKSLPADWNWYWAHGYAGVSADTSVSGANSMRVYSPSYGHSMITSPVISDAGTEFGLEFDFYVVSGDDFPLFQFSETSWGSYGGLYIDPCTVTGYVELYNWADELVATLNTSQWYHLKLDYDSGSYDIYLDDVLVGTGTARDLTHYKLNFGPGGADTSDTGNVYYDNIRMGQGFFIADDCAEIWEMGHGMAADINQDCYIDLEDFDVISRQWMTNNDPDFSAYSWDIGPVDILDVTPNGSQYDVSLKVSLENNTNRFRAFELTCDAYKPGGGEETITLASIFGADKGQTQQLPFTLSIPQGGDLGLDFFLKDKQVGFNTGRQFITVDVPTTPLDVQITKPYYRSAIYATMSVSSIEVQVNEKWPITTHAGDSMKIELRDPCDNLVNQVTVTNTADFFDPQTLSVSSLAVGDYSCTAQLIRNSSVLYENDTILHVYAASTSEVRVNEHLNFVLNGQEYFPIGTFHAPWDTSIASSCNASISYSTAPDLAADPCQAAALAARAANGQYMTFFPHTPELWTHIVSGNPELAMRPLPPEDAVTIGERVAQYTNQPGIWAWYMADEPAVHTFIPEYLEALGDTIRQYDPYHPAYISYNHGGNAEIYRDATDALGVHWYPGFTDSGMGHPMTTIADNMETAKAGVDNKQAIIFSPQLIMYANNSPDDIRPTTHQENRCMAYLSLVHGAKGIIWFSTGGLKSSLEIRIGMPYLASELRSLEDVFLAHDEVTVTTGGSNGSDFHCLAKEVDGQLYLIVVNASEAPATGTVTLSSPWNSLTAMNELAATNTSISLSPAGQLNLTLDGYGVRIFTTDSSAPSLVAREAVEQMFDDQDAAFLATGNLCYISNGVIVDTSEDYGPMGKARLAVDGYTDYANECVRNAKQDSFMTVTFASAQTVDTIVVHTGSQGSGPLRDYHLELQVSGTWVPANATVQETVNGDYLAREHSFTPVTADAIRLTLDADMVEAGYLHEIQAFAP